jgi:hypothetical protein
MVAELLGLGVQPDLTGLDGLAMSRGRARRICAKGLAEKSEIGENVGRVNVIVSLERNKHGKRAAAAGKSHRFSRDTATGESGPR